MFTFDPAKAQGMQTRAELMKTPTQIQRPATKKLFLTARNDLPEERTGRFSDLLSKLNSRPLRSVFQLSNHIVAPTSLRVTQLVMPAVSDIYNVHPGYANDTLMFLSHLTKSIPVTIPPGRYNAIFQLVQAVNDQLPTELGLSFSYDPTLERVLVSFLSTDLSGGSGAPTTPRNLFFIAPQYGGLAEMLGFSALDLAYYNPSNGIYTVPASSSSSFIAPSPPKLWIFHHVFLHIDDHLGGGGRAQSDAQNEFVVANHDFDQNAIWYQGANSNLALSMRTSAPPPSFQLALATIPLQTLYLGEDNHGSFLERTYTHHQAQQYNNAVISQITASFTNEFNQLLVGPPSIDYSLLLQINTLH